MTIYVDNKTYHKGNGKIHINQMVIEQGRDDLRLISTNKQDTDLQQDWKEIDQDDHIVMYTVWGDYGLKNKVKLLG